MWSTSGASEKIRRNLARRGQTNPVCSRRALVDDRIIRYGEEHVGTGFSRSKIESGGSEVPPQEVDEEQAVAAALTAFEDGMYLVVLDDQEQRDLDAQVYLQPDSRLTFVRLTLLAGG